MGRGRCAFLIALAACGGSAEFEPCAVRCGAGGACPEGLTCADGFCARAGEPSACPAADGAGPSIDGRIDGPIDGFAGVDTEAIDAPPPECEPAGDDDACVMCAKASCCEDLVRCLGTSVCACYASCFVVTHDLVACVSQCGTADQETYDLDACRQDMCPSECNT